MKIILKLLGLVSLWSLLAGMVIYVDPALVADVLWEKSYLPFMIILYVTLWYSLAMVVRKVWLAMVTALIVTLAVGLSIAQLLYWFVVVGIAVLLFVVYYLYFSRLKRV